MKQSKRRKRMDPNTLLLIRKIMGGVLVVVGLSLLILLIWHVTRIQSLNISKVTVSGGETISHELVKELAESELAGEYLRLIPKRFFLTYPQDVIVEVVSNIDRIKGVQVERNSPTTLSVSFSEFIPDALWCNDAGEDCVFLDRTGYAFATAPDLSGGSFLRLDKLGVEPVTKVQAFEPTDYQTMADLVVLLENVGWFVSSVEADVAGDAYLTLADGGELKVALKDEPQQIVENLFTVLGAAEFSELEPGAFEYIDLRYGNKVFVNELGTEVATSTEDALE